MELQELCTGTPAWTGKYAKAFRVERDGKVNMILRYALPFPAEEEAALMEKYGIRAGDRLDYYRNLAFCIDREVTVSEKLRMAGVPSILTFSKVEQYRDENGIAYVFLETEEIYPITQKLLHGSVNAITVIDVIMRLSIILRDIEKDPCGVIHRGLDLDEVYINAEDRIKLGGFYYAVAQDLEDPPGYLPDSPSNIPQRLLEGEPGDSGSDLRMLSCIAWNLFSGLPWDAQLSDAPLVYPELAPEELVSVLQFGMEGRREDATAFRRRLMECRKLLNKSEFASKEIQIAKPARKQYTMVYR